VSALESMYPMRHIAGEHAGSPWPAWDADAALESMHPMRHIAGTHKGCSYGASNAAHCGHPQGVPLRSMITMAGIVDDTLQGWKHIPGCRLHLHRRDHRQERQRKPGCHHRIVLSSCRRLGLAGRWTLVWSRLAFCNSPNDSSSSCSAWPRDRLNFWRRRSVSC
jgi:hypothetical protein